MAAMTQCRTCKREVATDAARCPYCGTARPSRSHNARMWVLVIALIIALQVWGYFAG